MGEKPLLKLAKKIIGIDSTNPHGTLRLARFIGSKLTRLGFKVSYQRGRLFGVPQANLIAQAGPTRGIPLLFNTHLDTVITDAKKWTKTGGNPFKARLIKGVLYGLGAADTKLALACQLVALETINIDQLKRPLMITGTYGEEVGLVGVQKLIVSPKIPKALVLNSEPTQLRPCIGNRGFRIYQIRAKLRSQKRSDMFIHHLLFLGRQAHSAVPQKGVNAILNALDWCRLQEGVEVFKLNGGLAANIVPPSCEIWVAAPQGELKDYRDHGGRIVSSKRVRNLNFCPLPAPLLQKLAWFLKKSQTSSQTSNLGIISLCSGFLEIILDHRFPLKLNPDRLAQKLRSLVGCCLMKVLRDNPPFYQPPQGLFVRTVQSVLKDQGEKGRPIFKPGCTEAGYFSRMGCETITIGPGVAYGNAHEPNESIRLRDLEKAILFYREIIKRLCF